jgi:hypothetical protein
MATQAKDELFVTIRNGKGEPVCTVERAVAERLGWLKGADRPAGEAPSERHRSPQRRP